MVFGKFDLNQTSVSNSRFFKRSNIIWRRRKTEDGFVFTTRESLDLSVAQVRKRSDQIEPYQPAKLLSSLIKALEHLDSAHSDSWHLMQTIEVKLLPHLSDTLVFDTSDIAKTTLETLQAFNRAAYLKYASFQDDEIK